MLKSTSSRSLFITIGGFAAVAAGAYVVWTNRARIMKAVEKTGLPEKFSDNLDKVTGFASNQLGLKTDHVGNSTSGRNSETRAS